MNQSTISYTLGEIAQLLNAELQGDPHCRIFGIASLDKAVAGEISFLANPKLHSQLSETQASAVILSAEAVSPRCPAHFLITKDPYLAYAKVATLFVPHSNKPATLHPTVIVGRNTQIGNHVNIGPYCVLGDNVTIGENTDIGAGCVIGDDTHIGYQCKIYPRVTLYHNVLIGARGIIHSGVVIGSDGFGMANEQGKWHKIPQLGGVEIGNDVEIGANTTIDRGALENTIIEEGVKLDNLIQIAHNVRIGAHTAIAACVGIAGSTKIGKYCMIGGGASIIGHIEIADHVNIVGTAVVEKNITEAGTYASGVGIMPFREFKKLYVRLRQLDDIAKRLKKLEFFSK